MGCFFARAKYSQASLLEHINNSRSQNVVRTYYREVDRLLLSKAKQSINISGLYRNVPPYVRGPGISGRDEDLFDSRRLTNFPGQRMFTAPAADHQYFHTSYRTEGTYTVVVVGSCDLISVKRFPLICTTFGW